MTRALESGELVSVQSFFPLPGESEKTRLRLHHLMPSFRISLI
jgi:hypothetical protein